MSKGFGQIMQQAKKMQERLVKVQEELAERKVEGQSGGGMVTAVVNGKQELVSLKIAEEVWQEKDKDLLEDLIIAAINEGLDRSREMMQDEMSKITGGMQLPFGM